jgi:hypothetical protein
VVGLLGNVFILLVSLFILDRASDLVVDNAVKAADLKGLGKTYRFYFSCDTAKLPELSVLALTALGLWELHNNLPGFGQPQHKL